MRGDLRHEVFDDGPHGVAGGPDEEAVGDRLEVLAAVGRGVLGFDGLVRDLFDHGFGADADAFFFKGRFGVVNEGFGKGLQDGGELWERELRVIFIKDASFDSTRCAFRGGEWNGKD